MKDKIFVDSDVILDSILSRKPYMVSSNQILALAEKKEIACYTSSLILANIYYIIRKLKSHKSAIRIIDDLSIIFEILPFSKIDMHNSIKSEFKDFEDGVQNFIALNNRIGTIITRNKKDYKHSTIGIFSPQEFLTIYYSTK